MCRLLMKNYILSLPLDVSDIMSLVMIIEKRLAYQASYSLVLAILDYFLDSIRTELCA